MVGVILVLIGALIPLCATPASAGLPGSYRNPLSPLDTPDPDVVRLGTHYYAFSTGDGYDNIPVMTTTDLSSWPTKLLLDRRVSDALPCRSGSVQARTCQLSNWGTRAPRNGAPWSPSMIEVGAEYYLFYAAWDPTVGHYCIGVAGSSDPMGPYVDDSEQPVVCQPQLGGSIDPDVYQASPGHYDLAWKNNDGYGSTVPATLWASAVEFDAGSANLVGPTTPLLTQSQPWETTIEQPQMVQLGRHWMLFFSGGLWQTSGYAIAYAYCQGPAGPCADPNLGPVFASSGATAGPGAPSIFTDTTGTTWMAYAAWTAGGVGYPAWGPQPPDRSALLGRCDAGSPRTDDNRPATEPGLPDSPSRRLPDGGSGWRDLLVRQRDIRRLDGRAPTEQSHRRNRRDSRRQGLLGGRLRRRDLRVRGRRVLRLDGRTSAEQSGRRARHDSRRQGLLGSRFRRWDLRVR